jgi:hypothetical protein
MIRNNIAPIIPNRIPENPKNFAFFASPGIKKSMPRLMIPMIRNARE